MFKNIAKTTLACVLVAIPGVAQAGVTTATATVTLTVVTQCTVTGASINLGAFSTLSTWGTIGAALGMYTGSVYTAGSQGLEYINWGSVTCDNGTPYTLKINGRSSTGAIKLSQNGKVAILHPFVKKLGASPVADNNTAMAGAGAQADERTLSGTGIGLAQDLRGSALLDLVGADGTVAATTVLSVAGTSSDTLTYTLNF